MGEKQARVGYYRIYVHFCDAHNKKEDRIQVDYYSDCPGKDDESRFIKGTTSPSPVEIRVFTVSEYEQVSSALEEGRCETVKLIVGHVIDPECDGLAINKVVISGGRKGTDGKVNPCKIQGRIEECPPPKFIPISNNCQLNVTARAKWRVLVHHWFKFNVPAQAVETKKEGELEIQVVDRKQGSAPIAYTTKDIRLTGVDLRAYGHLIRFVSGSKISVQRTGEDYFLLASGVNLQIEGLRTVDASEARIKSKYPIEVSVNDVTITDQKKSVCQVSWRKAFRKALFRVPWGLYALVTGSILWVVVMTALPVCFRDAAVSEFQRQLAQLPQVKVEETTTSDPTIQPPKELKVRFRTLGYGALCVWFVLAAGVYLVLYFLGVIALVLSCRAVRRHRKLNGDISGVIAALRAERDKTARDRMKKRILDNLLSTYLGERSED